MRSSTVFKGPTGSLSSGLKVVIGTDVTPYPAILDASSRFHHRGGPNKGKSTKGWLTGVLKLGKFLAQVRAETNKALARYIKRMGG